MGDFIEMRFQPIGVVRTQATDAQVREGHVDGELEIFPEFEQGLDGIDGYSHLFVIFCFHNLRPEQIGPLKVKPKGLARRGFKLEDLPLLGVFALDSPTRPNPIGLTLVQLISRKGRQLFVRGIDCFNGTPILDIKGYRPPYRAKEYGLPEWYTKFMDEQGNV